MKEIVSRNLLFTTCCNMDHIFLISYKFCAIFAIASLYPLPYFIRCLQRWSTMTARYDLLIMNLLWCMLCSVCIDRLEEQPPPFLPYDEMGIPCSISTISLKEWLGLCTLLLLYIFLGASFYYHLEGNLELGTRLQEYNEGLELQGEFINKYEQNESVSCFSEIQTPIFICFRSM